MGGEANGFVMCLVSPPCRHGRSGPWQHQALSKSRERDQTCHRLNISLPRYQRISFKGKRRLCLILQALALVCAVGLTVIGGDSTPAPSSGNSTHNGTGPAAGYGWGPQATGPPRTDDAGGLASRGEGRRYSTTAMAAVQVVLLFFFTFGIGIAYYIPLHAASVRNVTHANGATATQRRSCSWRAPAAISRTLARPHASHRCCDAAARAEGGVGVRLWECCG